MKRRPDEHSPGLVSGPTSDLDQVIATAAQKLPSFASNRIVMDNAEAWKVWEAIRVVAVNLREIKRTLRESKTGTRSINRTITVNRPRAIVKTPRAAALPPRPSTPDDSCGGLSEQEPA